MFSNTQFRIFASQLQSETIVPLGTALSLYRDFVNDKQLNGPVSNYRIGPDINYVRNSFATYIDIDGVIKTVDVNVPRFEYSSFGQYQGLLIENQTTNLIPYSTDFTQTSTWVNTNLTVQPSAGIAPDGTNTATLITSTTGTGYHILQWGETEAPYEGGPPLSAAEYYDRSIFVKQDTARYLVMTFSPTPSAESVTNIFDFVQENFITPSTATARVIPLSGGWYRLSLNRLSTNSNTNRLAFGIANGPDWTDANFTGQAGSLSSVYVWGAQVEKNKLPTSYIFTNGSEVTRAGDNLTIEDINFTTFYNPTASSLFVKIFKNFLADNPSLVVFTNNIGIKHWGLLSLTAVDQFDLVSTESSISIQGPTLQEGTTNKFAVGLQNNDFVYYLNNTFVDSLTSIGIPGVPAAPNQIQIGRFLNERYFNGHIQELGYWPTRLTNEQLSAL